MTRSRQPALEAFGAALQQLVFTDGHGLLVSAADDLSSGFYGFVSALLPDLKRVEVQETESSIGELENLGANSSSLTIALLPSLGGPQIESAEFRQAHAGKSLGQLQLEALLSRTQRGARVATMLPRPYLVSSHWALWRKELFWNHALESVVFCSIAHPYAGSQGRLPLALLVLRVGEGHDAERVKSRFVRLPATMDDDYLVKVNGLLQRFQEANIPESQNVYETTVNLLDGGPITFERFHPAHRARRQNVAAVGEMRLLSELVDIIVVPFGPRAEHVEDNAGGSNVVTSRNIRSGRIELSPEDSNDAALLDRPVVALQSGDIVLPRVYRRRSLHLAQVTPDILPASANHSVLILRPRSDLLEEDISVLVTYLESEIFSEVLAAEGVSLSLVPSTLRRLEVPTATRDVALAIAELNYASERLEEWSKEAREAKRQLFGHFSGKRARLHILEAGREVRQRVAGATLIEDFAYRVRTRFPLPIAYRWRAVQAANPNLEGYVQVLECAEAALAYTALIAIYLSRHVGREPFGKVREIAARFSERRGSGINFGDWRSILDEASSRKFRRLAATAPFFEVTAILDRRETRQAIEELIGARNDQSHGRGPKDAAIEVAFAERKAQLEVLLKGVEFLSDYPLRFVESCRWDSIRRENYIKYRDLAGDHPLTPVVGAVVASEAMEQGSLYLIDRSGAYHLLRPLLVRKRCPECGALAIFALDAIDHGRATCRLKGLEHEHVATVADQGLIDALKVVGFASEPSSTSSV